MVMDIFTLKSQQRPGNANVVEYVPNQTVNNWNSLIWTERYNDFGEFKMTHQDPKYVWDLMPPGTLVGCNASNEVMLVENHETKFSVDRGPVVEVSGRSILAILNHRIVCHEYRFYNDKINSTFKSTDEIGRKLNVYNIGSYIAELINNYGATRGGHIHNDTAAELPIKAYNEINSTPTIKDHNENPGILWDHIRKLLSDYHYGVRVDRVHTRATRNESNLFAITVFEGRDLSKSVIFSEDNNTLVSTSRLRSIKNYYNKLWVVRNDRISTFEEYPVIDGVRYTVTGFDYRVGYLQASDSKLGDYGLLADRAKIFFLEHQNKDILSGEVAPSNVYEYRRDYYIGDKVAFKSQDGTLTNMWVKEFIYSEDENGFKQYPTFESEQ